MYQKILSEPVNYGKRPINSKGNKDYHVDPGRGIYIVIFMTFSIIYFLSFDTKLDLNGDNASYYLLGKSLATGQGYILGNDIEAQRQNAFAPGYPCLIAILMFFSQKISFIKFANGVFLLGSLLLGFQVFRQFKNNWLIAFISTNYVIFNYHIVKSSTIMMSEIPFLFFTTLTIFLFTKIDFSKNPERNKVFYFFLLSLSFTLHIKGFGLALWVAIILHLLLKNRKRSALLTFSGSAFLALPWILYNLVSGLKTNNLKLFLSVNPYQQQLGNIGFMDLAERIFNNIVRYTTREIPQGMFPFLDNSYDEQLQFTDWLSGCLILVFVIQGLRQLTKYRSLLAIYLLVAFAMLLVWPEVWKGARFIIPLIPILIFLTLLGFTATIENGLNYFNIKFQHSAALLLPLLFFFIQDYKPGVDANQQGYPLSRIFVESKSPYPPNWQNYIELARYSKHRIKASHVIACRKPQLFHIFSGRYTCNYPNTTDDQKFLEKLNDKGVTHIVVDKLGYASTGKYVEPAINKNLENFKVIRHLKKPDTFIVQFLYD